LITEISGPFSEICKKMDSRLGMEVGMIYETVIWFIWSRRIFKQRDKFL